jgi:hypothetical protein
MFEQNIDIAGSESKSLRRKQAQAPLIAFSSAWACCFAV